MKKENTYTEMGTNIRGYKIYYKGCSPFKDTVKIGIASILVGSGGYCAYRSIKNNKDNNVPLYLLVAVGVSIFIQDFFNKDSREQNVENFESKKPCVENESEEKPEQRQNGRTVSLYSDAETLNEICSKPSESIESSQLCGEILGKGDCLTLYSNAKEGKSTLAMGMCIDIANGMKSKLFKDEHITHTQRPTRVIYYDSESSIRDLQNRYKEKELASPKGQSNSQVPSYPNNLSIVRGTFTSVDALFDDIERRAREHNSDVVVCIDNLANIIPNDSKQNIDRMFFRQKMIKSEFEAKGYSATFIIVTHTPKTAPGKKNENIKGSSQILNLSTTVVELLPTDLGREYKQLKIQFCRKPNSLQDKFIILKRVEIPYLHFEYCDRKDIKDESDAVDTYIPKTYFTSKSPKCPHQQNTPKKTARQSHIQGKLTQGKKHQPNLRVTTDIQNEIIKLYNQGKGPSAIGQKLGLSRKTITRWINRLKEEGRISA